MNVQEGFISIIEKIAPLYEKREANNIADLLIEYTLGISRTERLINKNTQLTSEQKFSLQKGIKRLMQHEPIQYITGKAWFYKYLFNVSNDVLIPRPETEELVSHIIKQNTIINPSIIDIGTGSGCIAISLKKNITANISAIDISMKALSIAKDNASNLNANIQFNLVDFLDETSWNNLGFYDIIVSNPPYIKSSERLNMFDNVLKHEPHSALFVSDDDPLIFYQKIALFGTTHLKINGTIWVEINESLGCETASMFEKYNYEVTLYNDLQNKDRIIRALLT